VGHAPGLIVLALVAAARTAAAEDASEPGEVPAAPPFVPGQVALRLGGELGEHTQSLALDAWYDVNARFRLGISSSSEARRELGALRGLCLHGCGDAGRFAGLAAETQIDLGPSLVGRAAVDTSRFGPTAAAIELGLDAYSVHGRWRAQVSPVLRLGIARRDLSNGDSVAALTRVGARVWRESGVFGEVRIGLALDDLRGTPSFGAAGGVYVKLGGFVLTATFGSSEVARTSATDSVFGELALGWSSGEPSTSCSSGGTC
jgi:hypothetical protein